MPYFKINNPLLLPPPLVVSPWFGKKFKFMPLRLLEMQNARFSPRFLSSPPWKREFTHLSASNFWFIFTPPPPPPPQQKAIKMDTLHTTETKEEQ